MDPNDENSRQRLIVWVGWVLSVGLVILAFRIVPVREVWNAMRATAPAYIVMAMVLSVAGIALRGWRWASIFGIRQKVSVFKATRLTAIGLAINAVVPGRIGDIAKIGMAMRLLKTDITFTVTTVLVERLLDAITLLAFFGVSLSLIGLNHSGAPIQILGNEISLDRLISVSYSLALIILVLLVLIALFSNRSIVMLLVRFTALVPVIGARLGERISSSLANLSGSLRQLRRPRTVLKLGTQSIVIWIMVVLGNVLVGRGMEGISLHFTEVIMITALSIMASSLPSAPGAWGVYEAGMFFGLKAIDLPASDATLLAYAFATHLCLNLPVILVGVVALGWRRQDLSGGNSGGKDAQGGQTR